jgi:hypothetical protein
MLTYFFGHPVYVSVNRGSLNLCSLGAKRSWHSHLCSASRYEWQNIIDTAIGPDPMQRRRSAPFGTIYNFKQPSLCTDESWLLQTDRQTDTHTHARAHACTHTQIETSLLLRTCIYILTHSVSKFAHDVRTSIVLIAVYKVLICIHTCLACTILQVDKYIIYSHSVTCPS